MGVVLDTVGKLIAGYLQKEVPGYEPFTPSDPEHLRGVIEQGDVLLVEGNNRVSGIIKYLTQSTWSHAALYVGPIDGAEEPDGEPHVLIEANIGEGVTSAPLSKYFPYHTRLCRPVGLSFEDRNTVCRYAINRIGFGYDTKNILDLMRYLIPLPIPQRWRRRMIAFGSGDPTKIICSALIAQAFDAVRYPILPKITRAGSRQARREILHIRDSSLYMPRDFDISPYFEIVKPTIVHGFDYTALHWADKQKPLREVAGEFGPFPETITSPPLVPEEIDEATPLPAEEVTSAAGTGAGRAHHRVRAFHAGRTRCGARRRAAAAEANRLGLQSTAISAPSVRPRTAFIHVGHRPGSGDIAGLDPVDAKACAFDHRTDRAVEVTAAGDTAPDRRQPVLPAPHARRRGRARARRIAACRPAATRAGFRQARSSACGIEHMVQVVTMVSTL